MTGRCRAYHASYKDCFLYIFEFPAEGFQEEGCGDPREEEELGSSRGISRLNLLKKNRKPRLDGKEMRLTKLDNEVSRVM